MKLFGMLDVLEQSLSEVTRDPLTGSELMNRLIQAEVDYLKRRKTANRMKTARFRYRPSFRGLRLHGEALDHAGPANIFILRE